MKTAVLTLLSICAAWAQPALDAPQLGFIQDANSVLRPVYGIAGNFLIGPGAATGVVSSASSGLFGWIKTDSELILIDRHGQPMANVDAPSGQALFAFAQDGTPSLAFLVGTGSLIQWNAGSFQQVASIDGNAVLSIASPDSDHAALIVQRDDGLWDLRLLLRTGEIVSGTALPGVQAPVLMLPAGDLIYTDHNGLVIRSADGLERRGSAQLPENFTFRQMGDGWIQLGNSAARITAGREQFYALPEAEQ